MLGWFSAFREHGAPTWYGENRTPVMLDTQVFGLVCLFAIPSLAFLIVMPGLRRSKATSSIVFLPTMAIGASLLVALHYPRWHVAEAKIASPFKAFSADVIHAQLMVRIGLQHVNISLSTMFMSNNAFQDLLFNERFEISEVHQMERELSRALAKGLPYPILKVVEYLSVDCGGFVWGRTYRMAGYYTAVFLWLAAGCWLLSLVLLCLLPTRFAASLFTTGVLTLTAVSLYAGNLPPPLSVRFRSATDVSAASLAEESEPLVFALGGSFYSSLIAGFSSIALSCLLSVLSLFTGYELETCFAARRRRPDESADSDFPPAPSDTPRNHPAYRCGPLAPRCSSSHPPARGLPGTPCRGLRRFDEVPPLVAPPRHCSPGRYSSAIARTTLSCESTSSLP